MTTTPKAATMSDGPKLSQEMLLAHHENIGIAANLLNITSVYLGAPEGSGEEEVSEQALQEAIMIASAMQPEAIGNLLLAFTSLICATAPDDEVQRWFDHQAEALREAME
jgi:hypothetical protein